jgi:predicted kinase
LGDIILAMSKVILSKPVIIGLYGYPGSGKTYVAHHLTDSLQIAHVSADRIRAELFQAPRYDTQENAVISHLMNYMTEELLGAGVSVVYDSNLPRTAQRRRLRELAAKFKAEYLLIWLQIDAESAFYRIENRDRRTSVDKYAQPHTRQTFEAAISASQNPQAEDYLVISGKHNFTTQKNAIINRLYQMGLASSEQVQHNVAKPELINLVPNPLAGRVDLTRRNISIR